MKTTNINFINRCKNILSVEVRVFTSASAIIRTMRDESLNLVEYTELEDFAGVSVVKSEQTLGMVEAMTAAVANDIFGNPIIFVDNFFEMLSPETQEFILWHEVGHTKDEQRVPDRLVVNKLKRIALSLKGEVTREEAFADDYAVSMVGVERAVFALNEYLAFMSAYSFSGCDKEMQLRIDRIQATRRI